MINGDAESRAHWVTYALGTAATTVFGTKGAGTVTKTGVATTKAGAKKVATAASDTVKNMDLSRFLPYPPHYQLAGGAKVPYNVVDGNYLKDQLILKAESLQGTRKTVKDIENYRKTFFEAYPELEGSVVVHHAVEQQVLKRFPNLFSLEEIHALENLRGIPKEINNDIHLSKIRKDWNRFYRNHPNPTKEEVINYMIELDKKYGEKFNPPVKK
ncbi:hypothetical protein ACW2QC_19980 [Virgibacillus sp. FSP13]